MTPAGGPSNTTVSLKKNASVAVVKPGATVRFTIGWKNTGKDAAKNVEICDKLPSGLTFSSAPGATFKSGKACWSRKSVAVGKSLSFVVVAKVDADAGSRTFTNVATATASNAPSKTATPRCARCRRRPRSRVASPAEPDEQKHDRGPPDSSSGGPPPFSDESRIAT